MEKTYEIYGALLTSTYELLCTVKNRQLTREEFAENIKSLTGGFDIEYCINDTASDKLLGWYYEHFKSEDIKMIHYGIEGGMWTSAEYEEQGVCAVRGMGRCAVCGTPTNVQMMSLKSEWVCSPKCKEALKK